MNYKILFILLLSFLALSVQRVLAQSKPAFVQQENIKVSGITTDAMIYPLSIAQKQTIRVYSDGLGRAVQTVAVQTSPLLNDMIQPVAFDNAGRQTVGYLPYSGQSTDTMGSYRSNAVGTAQPAFYNQTSQYLIPVDTAAHARQAMESSPMQRMLAASSIGAIYQTGHLNTVSYRANSNAKDGNIYLTGSNGNFGSTYYGDGLLWVTDAKDADNVETLLFKDMAGRLILKRQVSGQSTEPYYDTYYVYNSMGSIRYVVPPKATHLIITNSYTIGSTQIVNLIYSYAYDNMGRLISKTVPNAGMTSIIYDPLNRPVLTQDANMAARNQWYYIKYDAKNRPAVSGIYTDPSKYNPTNMQTYVTNTAGFGTYWYEGRINSATNFYYTNNVFPTTGTALAYNYYDNYDWNDDGVYDYAYKIQGLTSTGPEGQTITEGVATPDSLKGVPTMSLKRTIGPGIATPIWLMTVTFFDRYGHVIQSRTNNQLNYTTAGTLTDTKTIAPDFIGKPMATKVILVTGSTASNTNTVLTTLNYDSNDRLLDVDQTYNGGADVHIGHYTYNELGQLIRKGLSYTGSAYLQNVDYRYNIRGQLLTINNSQLVSDVGKTNSDSNDLFGMQLMYDNPDAELTGTAASYSGRLSAVKWMSRNSSNALTNERSYVYSYDQLGRYTGSTYAERLSGSSNTTPFNLNIDGFDENGITYDDAGNIITLKRNSSTVGNTGAISQIDNLTYSYDSNKPNQLNSVADAATANSGTTGFVTIAASTGNYGYDNDGNLISDPYKGLNLKYNILNKVDSIIRTATGNAYISYTYNAAGNVIRKQVYTNSTTLFSTTDYIDGFVYTTPAGGAALLAYFPMPEGRVMNTSATSVVLTPEYVISDQQGNARFSFENNGSGGITIRQENSYYAFGEVHASGTLTVPSSPNKNLYNGGSEWQNDFSNLPDYHQTYYRSYDPALGRFTGVDPMPESAESMTVYQYAGNNPVMMNDPGGDLQRLPNSEAIDFWTPNTSFGAQYVNVPVDVANFGTSESGSSMIQQAEAILSGDNYGGEVNSSGVTFFTTESQEKNSDAYNNASLNMVSNGLNTLASGNAIANGGIYAAFTSDGRFISAGYDPINKGAITADVGNQNLDEDALRQLIDQNMLVANQGGNAGGDNSSESNFMKAVTSRSEMVDAGWTLARAPGLLSKSYGAAAKAAGKMGAMEVLGKVTGALSLYNDYNEYQEARSKGDTWGAAWSATKGVMQAGFLLGGGEEIELGWNLGTMAIDGIINYNKKE